MIAYAFEMHLRSNTFLAISRTSVYLQRHLQQASPIGLYDAVLIHL